MTFAVTIEHGDDPALADTAQVAATDIIGTLALAGGNFAADLVCKKIGYIGSKRYTVSLSRRRRTTPARSRSR
jgi:hypothetical protein